MNSERRAFKGLTESYERALNHNETLAAVVDALTSKDQLSESDRSDARAAAAMVRVGVEACRRALSQARAHLALPRANHK